MRVKIDVRPDKIGAKIRLAELNKIPVMIIVGEKEASDNTVSIRRRLMGDQGSVNLEELLTNLISEIKQRSQPHRESQ